MSTTISNPPPDSAPSDSSSSLDPLLTAKLISMLAIFSTSVTVGCAPLVLARCLRPLRHPPPDCFYGRLVSLLLCFGGGVLLFTTFLHLLPECRRTFRHLEAAGRVRPLLEYFGIEISEICVCSGFFVVFAVEETVHFVLDRRVHRVRDSRSRHDADANNEEVAAVHRTVSMRRCADADEYPGASAPSPQCLSIAVDFNHVLVNGRKLEPEPESLPAECRLVSLFDHTTDNTAMFRRGGDDDAAGDDEQHLQQQHGDGGGHVVLSTASGTAHQSQTSLLRTGASTGSLSAATAAPSAAPRRAADEIRAMLRGLVAVLALSVHGVFEGLAVGLEQSPTNVWYMCVAIATHKLVVVFCVGMELVGAAVVRPAYVLVYVCGFAVTTPFGTALGVLLSLDDGADGVRDADGDAFEVVAAVLQAMAAGTLLYVIFFEVLARDRAHPHRQAGTATTAATAESAAHANRHHYHPDDSGFYRLFAIIAGFLVMFVLHLVTHTGHEHTHGGGGGGDGGHGHSHTHEHSHAGQQLDATDEHHFGHAHADHHHDAAATAAAGSLPMMTTTAESGLRALTDLAGAVFAQTRTPLLEAGGR